MAGALENARKVLREAVGEKESLYGSVFSVSGPGMWAIQTRENNLSHQREGEKKGKKKKKKKKQKKIKTNAVKTVNVAVCCEIGIVVLCRADEMGQTS
jgi:hypothetical protein